MIAPGVCDCQCNMQGLLIQTFSKSIWQENLINITNVRKSPAGFWHCCSPQSLTLFCSGFPSSRVYPVFLPTLPYTWNNQTMLSHPPSFTKINLLKLKYSLIPPLLLLPCPLNILWICVCFVPSLPISCKFLRKKALFCLISCYIRCLVHWGCQQHASTCYACWRVKCKR